MIRPGYYEREASRYDRTRGGVPRASAAAAAVSSLLPGSAGVVLDIAGGTGIVGSRLGRSVVSLDRSFGMSSVAAGRLPGRVVMGDARFLPVADGSVDAVTAVWLLHLVMDVGSVVSEVARVLRPGGSFVTTVDKAAAHYLTGDDVGSLLGPVYRAAATDAAGAVIELAGRCGLVVAGRGSFTGVGQGRSPAEWGAYLAEQGGYSEELLGAVAGLPDQDRRRGDPEFSVLGFRKV